MADYKVKVDVEGNAIKELEKLETTTEVAVNSLAATRKELKEITSQLLKLEPGTEEFSRLAARAGELKDQMGDVAKAINTNAGPALEQLTAQSGDLASSLLSLDFPKVAASAGQLTQTIGKLDFKAVTAGINGAVKSFAQLGKALLANPIFLIASTIALIVANFGELKAAVTSVDGALLSELETAKKLTQEAKNQLDFTKANENRLKLAGKSEEEILKIKQRQTRQLIIQQKRQLELDKQLLFAQVQAEEKAKSVLKSIIDFFSIPLKLLLTTIDRIGSTLGKNFGLVEKFEGVTSGLIFNPDKVREEGIAAISEQQKALDALLNEQAGYELQLNGIRDKARDERLAKAKDEADKLAKIEAERLAKIDAANAESNKLRIEQTNELLNEIEAIEQEFADSKLTQYEKELQDLDAYYFDVLERAKKANADAIAAGQDQLIQTEEIEAIYADRREQLRLAEAARIKELSDLAIEKKKKEEDEKSALELEGFQKRQQMASDAAGALLALNDAILSGNEKTARASFAIGKALSLAQAIQNTYASVTAVLKDPTFLGPSRFIAASTAGAIGLANVIKIARTQFGGGASASSSPRPSLSGGSANAPTQGFGAFDPSLINNRPQQPIGAYVLASDVKSSGEALEKVQDRARL
jgi:hypothetical protein